MSILFQSPAEYADACGADPSFLCELVFDFTESETLAEVADAFVPLATVILIFLAAWAINRIVRRLIGRGINRLMESQNEKATGRLLTTPAATYIGKRVPGRKREASTTLPR